MKTKIILIFVFFIAIIGAVFFWYTSPTQKLSPQVSDTKQAISQAPLVNENIKDKYYSLDLSYPSSSLTSEIKTYIDKTKAEFIDSVPKTEADAKFEHLGGDRVYNLTIKTRITHSSSTISYVLETYQFTGGAHGGTTINTFNYDLSGKLLSLSDVLPSSVTLSTLSTSSRSYFYNKLSDQDKTEIDAGTEPKQENFNTWYIDGSKTVFVFGQYSIGPYVLGIQEFPFSL